MLKLYTSFGGGERGLLDGVVAGEVAGVVVSEGGPGEGGGGEGGPGEGGPGEGGPGEGGPEAAGGGIV